MIVCIVSLSIASFTGCKRGAAPALQPTATGSAITVSSGDKQIGEPGTTLNDPLVVQVNDDQGAAVVGALVQFSGTGDVHFNPAAVLTDSSGQATSAVTLGAIAGRYQLSASTPTKSQPANAQMTATALGYQQQLGSILNDKYCARCHDSESSAERVSNYDNLEVKPHAFTEGDTLNKMSDAELASIILHGGPALSRSALMPPYGYTLSPTDVSALIAYMRAVSDPPYQSPGTVYAQK
jgi:mono/diheme cytochrome c family protein